MLRTLLLVGLWALCFPMHAGAAGPSAAPCPPDTSVSDRSGDRVVFGNDLRIERCDHIRGDIVVLFGDAQVDGIVHGDIVVLFGDLKLGPSAQVEGDAVALSGTLHRAPQTVVLGGSAQLPELQASAGSLAGRLSGSHTSTTGSDEPSLAINGERSLSSPMSAQPLWLRLSTAVLSSLLLFLVGHFFLWIAPARARNLRRTLEAAPGTSLLMGGVVSLALGLLCSLLLISIIGWAALPFVGLAAAIATSVGMGGLLEALGDRIPLPLGLRSRSSDMILGTLLVAALGCLWAFGGLIGGLAGVCLAVMSCAAMGAAVLSSLGKRAFSGL